MSLHSLSRVTARAPVNYFLNVTAKCNLACTYCSSEGLYFDPVDELTTDDYKSLARQFDELGVFRLIFTGGEPFIRPDIIELIDMMRPIKRRVTINTNGTLIDRDLAKRLAELSVKTCSVSVDSADEQTNAKTRGKGTLAKALAGIEALKSAGVPVSLLAVITRDNLSYDNILGLAELGRQYQCSVSVSTVDAQGRGGEKIDELGLTFEQTQELAGYLEQVRKEIPNIGGEIQSRVFERGPVHPSEQPATLLPCDAGKKACAITADGWMIPCNKMPDYRCGNIRTEQITTIWKSNKMEAVRALDQMPTSSIEQCSECKYVNYCAGGCRAEAYCASKDLLGPNPTCDQFYQRGE